MKRLQPVVLKTNVSQSETTGCAPVIPSEFKKRKIIQNTHSQQRDVVCGRVCMNDVSIEQNAVKFQPVETCIFMFACRFGSRAKLNKSVCECFVSIHLTVCFRFLFSIWFAFTLVFVHLSDYLLYYCSCTIDFFVVAVASFFNVFYFATYVFGKIVVLCCCPSPK